MFADTVEDRMYLEEISISIVAEVAPEELDLFDELAEAYYQNPSPPDLSTTEKEDPLAFGIGGLVVPVTPAVLAMVSAVLTYLATEFVDVAKEESAEVIRQKTKELFKRLFTRPEKDEKKSAEEKVPPEKEVVVATKKDTPASLTKEQLNQIYKLATKVAKDFGMEPEEARKMAKALVGSAAMAG